MSLFMFRVLPLICVLLISSVWCQSLIFEVIKSFSNVTCSEGNVVFQTSNVGLLACGAECSKIRSCTGFTLDIALKRCVGCSVIDASTDLDESSPGMSYYRLNLPRRFGSQCSIHNLCQDGNQTCFSSKCVCKPGYSFDRTYWSCESGCLTYGTTFQRYPGTALILWDRETYVLVSIKGCMTMCVGRPWCVSFDYTRAISSCFLSQITAIADPGNYRSVSTFDYYNRNCQ